MIELRTQILVHFINYLFLYKREQRRSIDRVSLYSAYDPLTLPIKKMFFKEHWSIFVRELSLYGIYFALVDIVVNTLDKAPKQAPTLTMSEGLGQSTLLIV